MRLIVCIDERGGMAFNHRRQSRDRKMREIMNSFLKGKTLWMTDYSAKLFAPDLPDVDCQIHPDPVSAALASEYVLCEIEDLNPKLDLLSEKLQSLLLFRWNRTYPFDLSFPMKLLEGMTLSEIREFAGSSHEKITMEIYQR